MALLKQNKKLHKVKSNSNMKSAALPRKKALTQSFIVGVSSHESSGMNKANSDYVANSNSQDCSSSSQISQDVDQQVEQIMQTNNSGSVLNASVTSSQANKKQPSKKKSKPRHAQKYGKNVKNKYNTFKKMSTKVEEQPHESSSGGD